MAHVSPPPTDPELDALIAAHEAYIAALTTARAGFPTNDWRNLIIDERILRARLTLYELRQL